MTCLTPPKTDITKQLKTSFLINVNHTQSRLKQLIIYIINIVEDELVAK